MTPDAFPPPQGWRFVPLHELCVTVGYVSSLRPYFCPPGEGVPLIRSKNIRPGRLVLEGMAWVTTEFHEAHPKSQLQAGDVLFTRVGANAGDVCMVPDGLGEMHLSSAVLARPLPEHRKYVELFFRSPLGQRILKARIVGSVSERINTRDVEMLFDASADWTRRGGDRCARRRA
jgi:type I restriction enzyme S subunit